MKLDHAIVETVADGPDEGLTAESQNHFLTPCRISLLLVLAVVTGILCTLRVSGSS